MSGVVSIRITCPLEHMHEATQEATQAIGLIADPATVTLKIRHDELLGRVTITATGRRA
mgnify:CR=1 FL=1